jgi:pSer/pThr/pTyr-binding forkhead associated (FHA) protein
MSSDLGSGQAITYTLDLLIEADDQPIPVMLVVEGRAVVGRVRGDATGVDLDLAPYGASQRGVSRQHAAFLSDARGVFIEDLLSTSGTRINGALIKPNVQYRLRPDDEISLGMMRLTVRAIRRTEE